MNPTKLIFVGGFLGAGKTTLLWAAAQRLASRGQRVGLITNDQAPNLVDTGLLVRQGFDVREVAGSCFCCNFNALIDAASALKDNIEADVLIGEPVGSCTDLSATILQPLKEHYAGEFALTPLSVLVDPLRLKDILSGNDKKLHPDAAYIYRKQLEEADTIVVNKVDQISPVERNALYDLLTEAFPGKSIQFLSALTGEGIDEWLKAILSGGDAGKSIPDVDYDRYARGEAVLGWLNATCDVTALSDPIYSEEFCHALLQTLKNQFAQRSAEVGHVKILLETADGICVGNLTRSDADISLRGHAGTFQKAALVINARVEISPEELEEIVRGTLDQIAKGRCTVEINQLQSLRPGRPVPTHRYASIV